MQRPQETEFAPYYSTYTRLVPSDVLQSLGAAPAALRDLLQDVAPESETFAYGPGKWSIREVLGHVIDAERMFAFRALHFARGDGAPLPGMDQEDWAAASNAGRRELADLVEEFAELRAANLRFIRSLDSGELDRGGIASEERVTVRALVFILCGHELHHRAILQDRYLPALRG